jgi:hypothetical protein
MALRISSLGADGGSALPQRELSLRAYIYQEGFFGKIQQTIFKESRGSAHFQG